jgi:hypothetical protein
MKSKKESATNAEAFMNRAWAEEMLAMPPVQPPTGGTRGNRPGSRVFLTSGAPLTAFVVFDQSGSDQDNHLRESGGGSPLFPCPDPRSRYGSIRPAQPNGRILRMCVKTYPATDMVGDFRHLEWEALDQQDACTQTG